MLYSLEFLVGLKRLHLILFLPTFQLNVESSGDVHS